MTSKKIKNNATFNYVILGAILVLLAAGLVLLPKYKKHEGINPELLLSISTSKERYISSDELANKIVNQDPSILLVDVRNETDFNTYALPNALNIPLKNLLDENSRPYFSQDKYTIVLISNDNLIADQAWILCSRLGFKNIKVLEGGMNMWHKTIINPQLPTENMPSTAFDLYSFRKGASMYFGVMYPEQVKTETPVMVKKAAPKKVITIEKKKKMPTEGGC